MNGRIHVAFLFRHEASLVRLVSAVLGGISDDYENERAYLNTQA